MGKNNLLRKMTPERKNYRLYKAKKRWITACATFMFTLGISAGLNINNNAEANAEVEETPVTSAAGSGAGSSTGSSAANADSSADSSSTGSSASTSSTTSASSASNASASGNSSATSSASNASNSSAVSDNGASAASNTTSSATNAASSATSSEGSATSSSAKSGAESNGASAASDAANSASSAASSATSADPATSSAKNAASDTTSTASSSTSSAAEQAASAASSAASAASSANSSTSSADSSAASSANSSASSADSSAASSANSSTSSQSQFAWSDKVGTGGKIEVDITKGLAGIDFSQYVKKISDDTNKASSANEQAAVAANLLVLAANTGAASPDSTTYKWVNDDGSTTFTAGKAYKGYILVTLPTGAKTKVPGLTLETTAKVETTNKSVKAGSNVSAADLVSNKDVFPEGTTYSFVKEPDTSKAGEQTVQIQAMYKNADGQPVTTDAVDASLNVTDQTTQKVTFEFVDADNNETVVGKTYTQDMTPGKATNLNFTMKVPDHYQLASGQTIPTSYTLPESTTSATTVKIKLNEKIYFTIKLHDDDNGQDLYSEECDLDNTVDEAGSSWRFLGGDFNHTGLPTDVDTNHYMSAGVTVPDENLKGVLTGDQGKDLSDSSTIWTNPNYKWTVAQAKELRGATFTIHLREKTATRTATIHYVYGDGTGDKKGQKAADDATVTINYTRTATKDSATGQTTYSWNYDSYNITALNGQTGAVTDGTLTVSTPDITGYNALTNGDWTLNGDGSKASTSASSFDVLGSDFDPNQVDSSKTYGELNDHTVYYTPKKSEIVTFEFVDDDNNGVVVGETHTQSMTPGVETNLNFTMTVPEHYQLASGQSLPTSYTLDASATTATTVKIHLNEKMYFKITLHDDTDNKDLYTQEVDDPQSGGYTELTIPAGTFPTGANAGNYTSVSATGVPEGVTFSGDQRNTLENANSGVWTYPNFRWSDTAKKDLFGCNIVIHLKHNTTEVTTTEEANETSILHFVYGAGDHKGERASDDAKVVFHYKRTKTATKDDVNGKESNVKYTGWVIDPYWNYGKGYDDGRDGKYDTKATVSSDNNTVTFDLPTIDGYTALTTGDWTTTTANKFDTSATHFSPTSVHTLLSTETDGNRVYAAVPVTTQENTVYYVPTKETDVRTVTEHYRYVDSNGNDAGQAEPDAQVDVYFKKNYSNGTFKTNGSTNSADWTWDATLDDHWSLDTSEGDTATPGFKVVSGNWTIGSDIKAPTYTITGYNFTNVVYDDNGHAVIDAQIFVRPTNANADTIYTTKSASQTSKEQTIFFVKSADTSSSIDRVINVTNKDGITSTKTQSAQKSRTAVINSNDTGVKFGDWTIDSSKNQWADATSLAPSEAGYQIKITKSVDGGEAVTGSTDDLKAVTVTTDTKPEVINITYTQDPTEEATETEARTVTEHYIVAADCIVNGTFYKKGDKLFDDAVIEVYYKRNVTKDKATGKVVKAGNWEWDPSQGDSNTAGFKVISGKWYDIKGTKESPKTGSWSVDIPSKDGFSAITDGVSNGFNTMNLGYPATGGENYFTNDTDPTWYWRKTLTTYYIPSNIVRVINETAPDGTTTTTTQTSPFSGTVKLDNDDKGIVVSDATSGSWDAYTPKYSGYTIKVTKSVDGGEETTGSTDDLKAVTVTNDTKPEVINITYSATSKAELSGLASSTYGSPITWNDVNNGIKVTVTGPDSATRGTYTLTQGDVQFTKDGTTTTSLPTDSGTYTVTLTDAGKQNIEKKFGNKSISWTDDSGQSTITGSATYTINNAALTIGVTGSKEVTYGSQDWLNAIGKDPSSIKNSDGSAAFTLTIKDSKGNSIAYQLQDGDLAYTTSDGTTAATFGNAGTYQVHLTSTGLANIEAKLGNTNYTFPSSLTSLSYGTFTVDKGNIVVTLNGSQEVDYAVANGRPDASKFSYTLTDGENPVSIYKSDGTVAGAVSLKNGLKTEAVNGSITNVGTYNVVIKDGSTGTKRFQREDGNKGDNYNWTFKSNAKYVIDISKVTAAFSGQGSKTYNGKTISAAELTASGSTITVAINGNADLNIPTSYTLQDGDYTWTSGDGKSVGTYTLKLTQQGIQNIEAAIYSGTDGFDPDLNPIHNVELTTTIATIGTASFEIKQKAISNVKVTADDQSKTYDGQAASLDLTKLETMADNTISDIPVTTTGLTADDFDWYDQSGTKLAAAPTAVGQYEARLKTTALAQLQSANPNYAFTEASGTINYQITAKPAAVTVSGAGSKVYDGKATSASDVLSKVALKADLLTGQSLDTSTLTADDYSWFTKNADGTYTAASNPASAGTYYLQLNSNGISKLNAANPNYDFTASGDFTYTIDKSANVATVSGTQTETYSGTAKSVNYKADGDNSVKVTFISSNGGKVISGVTLSSDDFEIVDATGAKVDAINAVEADGTTPTNYHIVLTDAGLAKLRKAVGDNYSISKDASYGTLKINPRVAHAVLSGTGSTTYTGQRIYPDSMEHGGVTLTVDIPKNDEFYTFFSHSTTGNLEYSSDNGLTWTENRPKDVGTYLVRISADGLAAIKANYGSTGNIVWEENGASTITGQATLTVVKTAGTAVLSGVGKKTYDGSPITSYKTPIALKVTALTTQGNKKEPKTITLTAGTDYVWKLGSETHTTAPSDVGKYTIELTDAGKQKIKDTYTNIDWGSANSSIKSVATYEIDPVAENSVLVNTTDGNYSKTYDGTATHTIDAGKFTLTTPLNGNSVKLDTTGIDDSSYEWVDANGNKIDDPVNVGTYYVKLTNSAFATLQSHNKNYTLTNTGLGTYTITQATASATLSGSRTRAYNGQAVTDSDLNKGGITLTITYPQNGGSHSETVDLASGDYTWNTTDHAAPVNASDTAYTLSLNADHIKQLIEGKAGYGTDAAGQKLSNVKFADDAITGSADYTITKLAADATIANNATAGNYSKTYDGTATTEVDPSKLTISTQVNGKTVSLDTSTLTAGDYQWVDAAGNALSSNPQAVGTYHIALTADGLAKLNAANPNFTLTQTGTGTYTITQADASGVLSGSNSKTYNGNAVSLTELNSNGSIKVALTIPGLTGTHSYTLKTGDYYISGNATDAGTYTVSLTSAGVTAVKDYIKSLAGTGQDGQSNVQFADDAITGSATFTINASANVVKVGGSQTETYTGQKVDLNYQANGTNSVTITIANAAGNTTGKTADASTVTLDSGDFTVEGDPINVGTYHVVLTDAGVAKVQNAVGKNYQISQDSSAYGSLVITKATGTATLNGAGEKTYDGTAISSYTTPVKVTITAPNTATTVDLTAGTDYVWKKDGQTYTTAPVDAGDYTIELTAAGKAKITAENAANIDWANSTITSEATYKINKATATVGFTADSGQTVNYNGKTGQFDSTKFVPTISTNNGKTLTIPAGVALSLAGGDFAIDNDSTEPTELGSYTVKLTDTGLAKLKSATNNYNWVNNTSATYAIQKTTGVSVTLADKNGGQSVAYKGTAFDNSEIDVNDYAITLGNGQTYTLKNGDLEFAPNQDPTNTGTYQVQLSEQGKNAISALDSAHYSYKVESAGQGTFTITKATPQVVMKGAGQKVYDGTAITSYTTPIGITITAPGNPTLTLDSQDYQFVAADGTVYAGDQAPVNVGDYKIELTETGKEKIRQNTDDDTNLDWSKVDFANIGNGTYTITQAAGKAVLSGSNHRVYTGSQVTTADLNKTGGNIVVTISVSGVNKTIDYKLQDGDYSWTSGNATDAATYTLELNKANILQHLKAKIAADSTWKGNVDLTDAALTGSATFTVDPSANVVSVSGTQNESYTGSPISVAYEQGGSNSVKVTIANAANNADGATAPLTNVTLDSGDFRLAGESGNSATNHGTYRVVLTDAGIAKIQAAVGSNYAISQSDTDAGKLVISKATASAKLTGNGSSTYNGQPITVGDLNSSTTGLKVTVTGPTANASAYSLSSGDVEFSTDGQNWTTTMPTDAKTYQVRLTDQGKNGIISQFGNDNLVWTNASGESTITSDASYKINPLASDSVLANASDYTKTYDGAATSTIDPSKLKLTTTVNGQTVDLTTTGIDGSSFEWVDQDGNAISAPKNVGTYYLKLTDAAFATLQADNPNFTLTNTGLGKYTITQANASATLSGSGRRAYNGKGVTLDDLNKHDAGNNITLTIKYPANGDASHSETVALTADDFVWNTSDGSAPVDANSQAYTLSLKPSAIQKLIEDKAGSGTDAAGNALSNVTFADDAITGTADYTITSLSTAATISNNGDYGKTYDAATTDTIDPSKLKLTTQVDGQTVELNTTGMTGNDYEWVNATGNALSSNPKDVGTYYIKLTDGGLRKLQSLNPNFTLTQTGLGKYVISAAEATGTLTGSNSKVYDGNAISLDEINQGGQIKVNLNFPGSNSASYTLKDTDYDITGNATDAGSYTITLNSTGVTNVENYLKSLAGTSQSGDSNVKFADNAITGSASFTITASTNNATVSGTQTETYTGSSIGVSYNTTGNNSVTVSFKSTNGGKDLTGVALTSGDFQIVDADGNPTTAINAGGTYHIVLTDAGVTRIQSLAGNNYTISKDSSYGTLVIDKAIGKATFSGTPSYAYTGKAVSPAGEDGYLSKYTLTLDEPGNPTYTLQDGDVEFKVDGNWTTTAPVKVGTYAARLSQQGWNNIKKINSDNVTWSATASTAGTATYTITEANVTAALSGNGYKVYNGSAVTADELYKNGSTIKVELNGGEDIANLPTSYTLKQGDYEWVEGTAPTNVGKYHLKLTAAGISSIQAQIDHVLGAGMVKLTTTADQAGQASFEIKQTVSGKVQLHGNEETTYDGTVASFNPSSATDYGLTLKA
jgi:hypothetical protein